MKKFFMIALLGIVCHLQALQQSQIQKKVFLQDGHHIALQKVKPLVKELNAFRQEHPSSFFYLLFAGEYDYDRVDGVPVADQDALRLFKFLRCRAIVKNGIFIDVEEYIAPDVKHLARSLFHKLLARIKDGAKVESMMHLSFNTKNKFENPLREEQQKHTV